MGYSEKLLTAKEKLDQIEIGMQQYETDLEDMRVFLNSLTLTKKQTQLMLSKVLAERKRVVTLLNQANKFLGVV